MFCLEPLIAVGALVYGIETQWHKQEDITGPYLQAQTCKSGFAAYVKGNHEWVAGGMQYGFTYQASKEVSVTIQPQGGGSYSDTVNPKNGVHQVTKFHAGLVVIVSFQQYSILAEYNHMSNGSGINPSNEGQDNIGVQVGYSFK